MIRTDNLFGVPSNPNPFSSLTVVGLKDDVQTEGQLEPSEVAQHFEPLHNSTTSFLQTLENWRVKIDFTAVPLPNSVAITCTLVAEYLKVHEVGLSAAQDGFSFASSGLSYANAITPDIDRSEREMYLSHTERIAAQGKAKSGEALESLRVLRRKLNHSLDAMKSSPDSPTSAHGATMNTPHNEILVLESNLTLLREFEQCMDWHVSWWSRTSMMSIHQESSVNMYSQNGGELRRRGVLLQWTSLRDTYSEYTNKMQKLQDQYISVFNFALDPKIFIDIPTAPNPALVHQEEKKEISNKAKGKRDVNLKINSPPVLPPRDAFERARNSEPNRRQEEPGKDIHPVASAPLNLQDTNNTTRSGNGTTTTKTGNVNGGDYINDTPIADQGTGRADLLRRSSQPDPHKQESGRDVLLGAMASPPKLPSRINPEKHPSTSDPKQAKHGPKPLESNQLTRTKSGENDHISASASSLLESPSEGGAQPDSQVKRGNISPAPPSNRASQAASNNIPPTSPSPRIQKEPSRTRSRNSPLTGVVSSAPASASNHEGVDPANDSKSPVKIPVKVVSTGSQANIIVTSTSGSPASGTLPSNGTNAPENSKGGEVGSAGADASKTTNATPNDGQMKSGKSPDGKDVSPSPPVETRCCSNCVIM